MSGIFNKKCQELVGNVRKIRGDLKLQSVPRKLPDMQAQHNNLNNPLLII